MKAKRSKHSPALKAKVALAAIQEQETTAAIARRYKLNANMVYKWKKQLLENMTSVFDTEAKPGDGMGPEREAELLQKIGELTVERDFLSNGLGRNR